MRCPTCGTVVPDHSIICGRCRTRLISIPGGRTTIQQPLRPPGRTAQPLGPEKRPQSPPYIPIPSQRPYSYPLYPPFSYTQELQPQLQLQPQRVAAPRPKPRIVTAGPESKPAHEQEPGGTVLSVIVRTFRETPIVLSVCSILSIGLLFPGIIALFIHFSLAMALFMSTLACGIVAVAASIKFRTDPTMETLPLGFFTKTAIIGIIFSTVGLVLIGAINVLLLG